MKFIPFFFDKGIQEISERVILDEMAISDSLAIIERYGITSGSILNLDDQSIYLNNPFERHLHIIEKLKKDNDSNIYGMHISNIDDV